MPRPLNKEQLLHLSHENYTKLFLLIDSFVKEDLEKEFPQQYMNRNVRDVLAHLHHWHILMLDWYKTGMAGKVPVMPAEGYTWKTLPAFNNMIREKYRGESLATVRSLLDGSYKKIQQIIQKHTNEELFEKKKYKWTGSTSLAAYLISATSSHYEWARKLIKKGSK